MCVWSGVNVTVAMNIWLRNSSQTINAVYKGLCIGVYLKELMGNIKSYNKEKKS